MQRGVQRVVYVRDGRLESLALPSGQRSAVEGAVHLVVGQTDLVFRIEVVVHRLSDERENQDLTEAISS